MNTFQTVQTFLANQNNAAWMFVICVTAGWIFLSIYAKRDFNALEAYANSPIEPILLKPSVMETISVTKPEPISLNVPAAFKSKYTELTTIVLIDRMIRMHGSGSLFIAYKGDANYERDLNDVVKGGEQIPMQKAMNILNNQIEGLKLLSDSIQ
jgi:hypothetical protein